MILQPYLELAIQAALEDGLYDLPADSGSVHEPYKNQHLNDVNGDVTSEQR